jgi:hypothetical protein
VLTGPCPDTCSTAGRCGGCWLPTTSCAPGWSGPSRPCTGWTGSTCHSSTACPWLPAPSSRRPTPACASCYRAWSTMESSNTPMSWSASATRSARWSAPRPAACWSAWSAPRRCCCWTPCRSWPWPPWSDPSPTPRLRNPPTTGPQLRPTAAAGRTDRAHGPGCHPGLLPGLRAARAGAAAVQPRHPPRRPQRLRPALVGVRRRRPVRAGHRPDRQPPAPRPRPGRQRSAVGDDAAAPAPDYQHHPAMLILALGGLVWAPYITLEASLCSNAWPQPPCWAGCSGPAGP